MVVNLPKGYVADHSNEDDQIFCTIYHEKEQHPLFYIAVSPNNEPMGELIAEAKGEKAKELLQLAGESFSSFEEEEVSTQVVELFNTYALHVLFDSGFRENYLIFLEPSIIGLSIESDSPFVQEESNFFKDHLSLSPIK